MKIKKFLFTVLDVVIVLLACYWCLWLVFYFSATFDGSIVITHPYAIFERKYLVPAQSIGIPILFTVISIFLYSELRKKEIISKKYIILVLFNTIPLWLLCICQIMNLVTYWNELY